MLRNVQPTFLLFYAATVMCLSLIFAVPTIQAQTATSSASPSPSISPSPSPTVSPSPSEETTQNLRDRIERVVEEKKQAIKGAIDRIGTEKSGFIGEIQRLSEETITIRTSKGVRILAITDPEITILKDQKPTKVESLAVGDWVVAMGLLETNETFALRRLLVSSKTLRPRDYALELGSLNKVAKNTISFNSRTDPNTDQELVVTSSTQFQNLKGEKIALSDITEDMQALVIFYQDDKEKKIISVIRVLSVIEN